MPSPKALPSPKPKQTPVNLPRPSPRPAVMSPVQLLTDQQKDEMRSYARLCRELPDSVQAETEKLWASIRPCTGVEEGKVWFVCCAYIASIDGRLSHGESDLLASNKTLSQPYVTVSNLLKKFNVSIVQFFKRIQQLKAQTQLSDAVSQHFIAVLKKYLVTCPLFVKFEKIFDDVFEQETPTGDNQQQTEFTEMKTFAWTLLVYAKSKFSNTELVVNFHLLLCCLNYVMRLTPRFQLKPPYDHLRRDGGEADTDLKMLQKLCEVYDAKFEEVVVVQADHLDTVIVELPQTKGFIDIAAMRQDYKATYLSKGDIDELLFLQNEPHLMTETLKETVKPKESTESIDESMFLTPVRSAMTAIQKLRDALSRVKGSSSETLQNYFKECTVNPVPFIAKLLSDMKPVFVSSYMSHTGCSSHSTTEIRYQLATHLYYSVMETLLKKETSHLGNQHFSKLLHNETSHKCLLACSLEVVMAAYASNCTPLSTSSPRGSMEEEGDTLFPWALAVFNLQGFDFFVVLESFMDALPPLPGNIIEHLRQVECKLLQSEAWKQGSPVFEMIKAVDVQSCSAVGLENQSSNSLQKTTKLPVTDSPTTGSPRSLHGQGFRHFHNKVCRLAYKRLQRLCRDLEIPTDLQNKMWNCVEFCLEKQPWLMRDRHLDQLIMCSMFAVCKVVEQEIKFKKIVSVYKELPHASQQTYKRVAMLNGEDYQSIVVFYNQVFAQQLKNFILQFASNNASQGQTVTGSPAGGAALSPVTHRPLLPHASPSYLRSKNFYVSPLKTSEFKTPPSPSQWTPRTRKIVSSIGDSVGSAEKFRSINNVMKTARARSTASASKSSKRLAFEEMEGPGSEPVLLAKRKKLLESSLQTAQTHTDEQNGSTS